MCLVRVLVRTFGMVQYDYCALLVGVSRSARTHAEKRFSCQEFTFGSLPSGLKMFLHLFETHVSKALLKDTQQSSPARLAPLLHGFITSHHCCSEQ